MKRNIFLMIIVIISSIILTSGISHAITVIASPNPATAGQNVTVNISASFPPSAAPSCVIETNFGDGSPLLSVGTCTTSTCNLSTSHTYILPGIYTITAGSLTRTLPPLPPDPATTSITINCAPLTITTTSPLPTATVGQTYSTQLLTSGGQTPINFSLISGLLPPGLSLSSTGLISGTPTSSGNHSFTIQASDSCSTGAQRVQRTFSINVNCPALAITTSPLSSGTVGQAYSFSIQTSGGQAPITFSLASGSLPPGLSLSFSGLISGTPTTTGNYSFTVSATDSCSAGVQNVQGAFSITINPQSCSPLSITSSSTLTAGTVGQIYTQQLQTSGGQVPITYNLVSGSLPPGLSLNSTGLISGIPTTAGNYPFTIGTTDSCPAGAQNTQKVFSLAVNPAPCSPLSITTSSTLSSATVGQAYTQQLQTTGGQSPITFSLVGGTMPPGLTISSQGFISGNPTSIGSYFFTVSATDSCPTGSQSVQKPFSIQINPPPVSISVNPSSFTLPRGQSSSSSVNYQFISPISFNTTLSSSAGSFLVGNETIEINAIPLTVNIRSGTGRGSEVINIPVRVIERALQRNANSFIYTRTFTSTGDDMNLNAAVSFTITTEAGADFDIKRIEMYFENRRAEITIDRNYPDLKAFADIRFVGSGLLQGFWEVDGRVLSTVNQHLTFAGSITLQTPEIPTLPTFDPGSHIIRFIITSPVTEIPLPSIIYFVTSAEFEGKRFSIKLISPEDDSVLEYLPIKFGWEKLNTTTLFLIRFFDNPSSKPIFSAYAKDAFYALPEIVFKKIFSPGQKYYWKVEGFDSGNNIIGESSTWSFSFRKR